MYLMPLNCIKYIYSIYRHAIKNVERNQDRALGLYKIAQISTHITDPVNVSETNGRVGLSTDNSARQPTGSVTGVSKWPVQLAFREDCTWAKNTQIQHTCQQMYIDLNMVGRSYEKTRKPKILGGSYKF